MSTGTLHLVQTFRREGRALKADQPHRFKTADAAVATARRMVDRKAGVVALSMEVDTDADFAGELQVHFRSGQLPPELQDA
jgi:hypothetical protein